MIRVPLGEKSVRAAHAAGATAPATDRNLCRPREIGSSPNMRRDNPQRQIFRSGSMSQARPDYCFLFMSRSSTVEWIRVKAPFHMTMERSPGRTYLDLIRDRERRVDSMRSLKENGGDVISDKRCAASGRVGTRD